MKKSLSQTGNMLLPTPPIEGSAVFDGPYRYRLDRWWGPGPRVCWILHNPSKAGVEINDPTVRIGMGFSKLWGFDGMTFVNVAALIATNPRELIGHPDPFGVQNLKFVWDAICESGRVVAAWGRVVITPNHTLTLLDEYRKQMQKSVYCLGRNQDGSPRHPLRLAYGTPLETYKA